MLRRTNAPCRRKKIPTAFAIGISRYYMASVNGLVGPFAKNARLRCESFAEEALQESGETGAVAGFVFRHFVNRVVDRVEAELLGADGELEFSVAGARFGVGAHLKVRLRAGDEDFAEEFREFRRVFRFFKGVTLERVGDFRIALALRLTAHREIHSDFAAFAVEVGAKSVHDFLVVDLAVADRVNGRVGRFARFDQFLKLRRGRLALRALFRRNVAFVDVTADLADKFLNGSHVLNPLLRYDACASCESPLFVSKLDSATFDLRLRSSS